MKGEGRSTPAQPEHKREKGLPVPIWFIAFLSVTMLAISFGPSLMAGMDESDSTDTKIITTGIKATGMTVVSSVGYPTAGPKVIMPAPIEVPIIWELSKFPENFDFSQIKMGYQFYPAPEDGLVAIEVFFQEEIHKNYRLSLLDKNDNPVISEIVMEDGTVEFMQNYMRPPAKIKIEYLN